MDFISTAIDIATAFSVVLDIANQIYDCFSDLPRNYEKARHLMQDVRETLLEMQATYTKDMSCLDKDNSLIYSLINLEKELKTVHDKCAMLIPPVKLKRRDKFRLVFYSFWRREKVEELISELKEHVSKTLRIFILLSNMRIEGVVDKINEALTVTLKEPAASSNQVYQTKNTVSDAQLYLFAQTYTTPMTWMPETIPIEELSKAYLRRELANLDKSLQSLSIKWFENPPADIDIPPCRSTWSLNRLPSSDVAVHRDAIMQTFTIQTLLESPRNSWIRCANVGLSHLATTLADLRMHQEAISINTLRIDLCTAAATVYPNSSASGHVVDGLTNLSVEFNNMRNKRQSHDTGEKAVKRIKTLLEDTPNEDQMHALLARILAVEAENHPMADVALKLAEASVQKVEDTLAFKHTTPSHIPSNAVTESDFNDRITAAIERGVSYDLLFTYASMLFTLSKIQLKNELLLAASGSAKQTLIILNHLSNIYPHSAKILHMASNVLDHIISTELFDLNTSTEKSQYIETNVDVLMQLATANPQRWVIGLLFALNSRRKDLLSTGNLTEAQKIHQQILNLSSMAVDNHTDLKVPSETEGDYYYNLANYHFLRKHIPDAIYAARNAISQYSALEYMMPGRSPVKHFNILVFLSTALKATQQYDSALAEGFRAIQLLDKSSVQGHDPAILHKHMELLDIMMEALDVSSDSRALEWARDINARIKKLFLASGQRIELVNAQAPTRYASILQKNDLVEEAAQYLQDVLRAWEDTYGQSAERNIIGISYLRCLMDLPSIFKDKGETDKALYYSQEGMDVAEKFFSEGFDMLKSVFYINMTSSHTHLLCDAGRYDEALALSELVVSFARENEQANDSAHGLIQALCCRTFCQLYSVQPQAAITSTTEAVALCRKALGPGGGKMDAEANILTLLYVSLLNLADGLADSGDVDQALIYLQEAKDTLIKQEITAKEEVGSDIHSYIVLAAKKSRLLFAKGKYEEAAEIITTEVIEKERARAKARPSIASALIRSLRYAGILYCTLGRHMEGSAAASELTSLRKNISASSPSVARLVEVELCRAEARGLWKSVRCAKDKLTCHHQDF